MGCLLSEHTRGFFENISLALGHPGLPGTIPLFHHSIEKCPIGHEWEPLAGMPPETVRASSIFGTVGN